MARVRDIVPAIRRVGFIGLCRRVWQQVQEDSIFTWASALAYAWLFAIFPFFVILLSLVSFMPIEGKRWLQDNAQPVLKKSLPDEAYHTLWEGYLESRLKTLLNERPKAFLSVSLLLTIWAASGGMAVTINAMDKCYDIEKGRAFYKVRLLAIFMTLVVATLLIIVVVALPVATTVRSLVQNYVIHSGIPVPLYAFVFFDIARYAIGLLCMLLALSVLYYFGPCVRQRYRVLTPGSIFCVIVWLTLGAIFRLYVNHFGKYQETYGPVGGVVILLLFFYLDAAVLLIGAEINAEIDCLAHNVPPGHRDFRGKPWEQEHLSAALATEGASTG